MTALIELLPKDYGFVVIVLLLYCCITFYMSHQVARARNKYKMTLIPSVCGCASESAKIFNALSRGHMNNLVAMPMFFMVMMLGGIKHPSLCAQFGLLYTVARYIYFTDCVDEPHNRLRMGKFIALAIVGLMLCTLSFAWTLLGDPYFNFSAAISFW